MRPTFSFIKIIKLKQLRMKKIFTLFAMAFAAMSMNAQTTIAWVDGTENLNSVVLNDYTLTITGNSSKTWSKGSTITVDETEYLTIKLSNGAQNTITAPEGVTFNKVTFYSYINIKAAASEVRDSWWKEVNGTTYDTAESQGGIFKSCNQNAFDDGVIPGSDGLVGLDQPDKREFIFDTPVNTMTFTNKGEQVGFIMVLETVDTTTGISNVSSQSIDLNGPVYNLAGQRVSKSYKGVVISNGKKYVQK